VTVSQPHVCIEKNLVFLQACRWWSWAGLNINHTASKQCLLFLFWGCLSVSLTGEKALLCLTAFWASPIWR